jgi:hypothetical protein
MRYGLSTLSASRAEAPPGDLFSAFPSSTPKISEPRHFDVCVDSRLAPWT